MNITRQADDIPSALLEETYRDVFGVLPREFIDQYLVAPMFKVDEITCVASAVHMCHKRSCYRTSLLNIRFSSSCGCCSCCRTTLFHTTASIIQYLA